MPGPWEQNPPPPRKASRLGFALWLAALAAIGISLAALTQFFPSANSSRLDTAYMFRLVAILAVMSGGLLFIRDVNLKQTARNILLWVGVAGVLMLGFSYQEELRDAALRLRSGLIPGYPIQTAAREMTIAESESGSFFVYGAVNGTRMRFLVDTGASDIVLSPSDARRLGIDLATLKFDHPYESANGMGRGASTIVDTLAVGGIQLSNVPVSINGAEMSSSLLGMTFLKRLKSFGFGDRKLILRW